jgi:mono/diheme cytochrome c family protein
MMHKAFRIGLAAYALAGGGAIASAQDQVEAGAQLYEEHCMGCHGEKLKAPGTSFDLRKLHRRAAAALRQVRVGRQRPDAAVARDAQRSRT